MKGLLICPEGFEDVSELEIKEIIGKDSKQEKTAISFEADSYEELCRLAYKNQSSKRILLLLKKTSIKDAAKDVAKIKLDEWFNKTTTFRIKAKIIRNEKLTSEEIEQELGEAVLDSLEENNGFRPKVNLNNPDVILYAHVFEDKLYFGVDFTGFNAGKRSYKLFAHAASLNGIIAYGLVRLSGYDKKGVLLDCFSGSGMIAIETALFATGMSSCYYDKKNFAFQKLLPLKNIDFDKFFDKENKKIKEKISGINALDLNLWAAKSGSKNAKIAGVNKAINFSKADVEWLDTKFKKGNVDFIITHPPMISKRSDKKHIEKIYKEFFHQAEYILNDKGKIVIAVSNKDSSEALKEFSREKFTLAEERTVWQGKEEIFALSFLKLRN